MCLLGTLYVLPFDKQMYLYLACLRVQKLSKDFSSLNFQV